MNETRGLWRGKHDDIDSSRWVVGYLIKMWGKFCLQDPQCENHVDEIDPSTLGECTGKTDRKANLIFEHDIVADSIGTRGIIKYGEYRQPFNDDEFTKHIGFYIEWLDKCDIAVLRKDLGYWLPYIEVIGNIHDKPELMRGANNDSK